ncbi:uncharacterized protein L3040_006078 [Drepanopeziza brunnea f. sp. 'multigermtubi']|uniref:uncharacterized protein n=1 Tax=Drepanopeziza brunnea f. sp. 'multigermtubi' TaxID=698441 RepID=UPI0023822388|nr:hypothetical protein L3040_006078 [Drepanopeziza brunnea f. sp. 'multigermtubi']
MSSYTQTPAAGAFKAGGDSPIEPSPASTFGGSASSNAGDDVRTPSNESAVLSKISKLTVKDGKSVERYSPPFVRKSSQGNEDDPFTYSATYSTPRSQRLSHHSPTDPRYQGRSTKSGNWRAGSSSSSSEASTLSPSVAYQRRGVESVSRLAAAQKNVPDNRESRTTATEAVVIKSEDAQAIFPPSSCVFVANLLQSEADEALEVAVTQVFREYGTVYVKIRRDTKQMPFAFCQYTNDYDAERAIKEGRGRLIKGRPCRCEKAKAHRLFYFERKYGAAVTSDEVRLLLSGFGHITHCRPATSFEIAAYNLNEGVVVQFEMYDEGQAALQHYRNNPEFKMQALANMSSPAQQRDASDPSARAYLETYDVDKRSVFFGNLPSDVTEGEIHDIFQQFGGVCNITLHKSDSIIDVNEKNCFAFVEFQQQPSVSRTLSAMGGFNLRGKTTKIAQKDSESARSRRRQLPRPSPASGGQYNQSPAPRTMALPPTSPVAQMAPAAYPPPYYPAYPQGQYYYPGTGFAAQAQYSGYPASPYTGYPSPYIGPTYYAYTGSPSYAGATSAGTVSGSPTHPYYYNYGQYPSPVQGYQQWSPSPVAPQQMYFSPPTYSPTTESTNAIPDDIDRSATPTPAGYDTAADSTLESE